MLLFRSLIKYLALSAIILAGCKGNDVVSPTESPAEKKLYKIVQDDNNYSVYAYDNGKLTKYESISNSKLITSISLFYNSNNKPETEEYQSSNQFIHKKYYYGAEDRLEEIELFVKDYNNIYIPDGVVKYIYNDSGSPVKSEQFNNQNQLVHFTEYVYDQSGNLTEKRNYNTDGLTEVFVMEYDNNSNPLNRFKEFIHSDASFSNNNIVKSIKLCTGNCLDNSEITYDYKYGEDGLPVSRTTTVIMNFITTITIETFEYQY